jgi:hypothetical protein
MEEVTIRLMSGILPAGAGVDDFLQESTQSNPGIKSIHPAGFIKYCLTKGNAGFVMLIR